MTDKQSEFISLIYSNCMRYADTYGIKCVPAIVGQAIIESNFGKSQLASKYHNYFGLKCGSTWKGKSVNLKTKEEYTPNSLTTIRDNFRVYDSLQDGVQGYFNFINTKRYANLKGIQEPEIYLKTIKADGYATASNYVSTVMKAVEQYVYPWLKSEALLLSYHDVALEVIAGKWGNGTRRREALESAGYDYRLVQQEVNSILKG